MKRSAFLSIVCSLVLASGAVAQVSTDGLVGYWSGHRTARDSSPTGNHGTFAGSYVPGRVSGHEAFHLGTDKVVATDHPRYPSHTLPGWTVAFWFNGNGATLSGTNSTFIAQDDGPGFRPKWLINYGYTVFGPTHTFVWHVNDFNQERIFIESDEFFPDTSQWYHLAVVTDNANGWTTFYLNGANIGSRGVPGYVLASSAPLKFGSAEAGLAFGGLMNDVALYDRALSASEVHQLYMATEGPACPGDLTGSSDANDLTYGVADGDADADDFFYFFDQFVINNLVAVDLTGSSDPNEPTYGIPDGDADADDFFFYLGLFSLPCP
ncbi:MAG: LamG domain-containing protein [Phycisphaerales bacterium]|nr:LamG domain-containing protein [Phycisphaerales bacterium]